MITLMSNFHCIRELVWHTTPLKSLSFELRNSDVRLFFLQCFSQKSIKFFKILVDLQWFWNYFGILRGFCRDFDKTLLILSFGRFIYAIFDGFGEISKEFVKILRVFKEFRWMFWNYFVKSLRYWQDLLLLVIL